jgi:hypothetical protein
LSADKKTSEIVRTKDISNIAMKLDPEQTQLLLKEVPGVYHTEINDMLLCALAMTICEHESKQKAGSQTESPSSSTHKVVIGLEGHGRENITENIDTTRTVGWFTNLYPLLLEVPEAVKTVETVSTVSTDLHLSSAIKTIKEQLRRVPDKGLGYGVLKYINKDEKLSKHQCWDIVFNYLGQLDNVVSVVGKQLSGAGESRGSSSDAEQAADLNFR